MVRAGRTKWRNDRGGPPQGWLTTVILVPTLFPKFGWATEQNLSQLPEISVQSKVPEVTV
jgi:hypothetical protein